MNGSIRCTAIVLFIACLCGLQTPLSGQYDSLMHDGRTRYFLQHLPANYHPDNTYSLIIAMHGGFGSGPNLEDQSQLSVAADEQGFIVVYPEGVVSPLGIRTWNAGGCCGYSMNQDIDDVGFIDRLLDTLLVRYPIDPSRVYATGMSNGGFMSYRLACELPERFAAIAPVASSMLTNCSPELSVPVIHFHSYLDDRVPWDGGMGSGVSDHYNPPLDSVMNVWAGFNDCAVLRDTLREEDDYDHFSWSDCHCRGDVELYITHDGGHSWPGGMPTIIGDPPSQFIEANALMWSFFQEHENCTVPVSVKSPSADEFQVYPNPFRDEIDVLCDVCAGNMTVSVFNIAGELVERREASGPTKAHLNLEHLRPGIYFIRLHTDRKHFGTRKVVKAMD